MTDGSTNIKSSSTTATTSTTTPLTTTTNAYNDDDDDNDDASVRVTKLSSEVSLYCCPQTRECNIRAVKTKKLITYRV